MKVGLKAGSIGREGYCRGIFITEAPSIFAADNTVLEAGFVVRTEPSVALSDEEYIVEVVHLITRTGMMTLTPKPRSSSRL